ncbi:MAG: Na+/proline symporter [Maioricimonas sp. JB049]
MSESPEFWNWLVLVGYALLLWALVPRRVDPEQFYGGHAAPGQPPGVWLVASSAAISWLFAKSIDNAATLSGKFGPIGGIGYAIYYLSFPVAGLAIYLIRVRGGYDSLAGFLTARYGRVCTRLFLTAIFVRLMNEVWSNTKVCAQYFGDEGTTPYWLAVLAVTAFTVGYSLVGGLRSSLLTDGGQMVLAGLLLLGVLVGLVPGLLERGLPAASVEQRSAGLTFCGLALVQVFSYPFHDPVLTDRGFITSPRRMLWAFLLAGLVSGTFILLFSCVGLYAQASGVAGKPTVAVPAALGLPMMLLFNGIMLTSAGSTLDSTFSSTARLAARDWSGRSAAATSGEVRRGRVAMVVAAGLGNLPLLSLYLGEQVGPAVIAATTISGTMVMGLAPIILLGFVRSAGPASFHLAFWPGILLGGMRVVEGAAGSRLFPNWVAIGSGPYAIDLGINLYGVLLCTTGYLTVAALAPADDGRSAPK